MSQKKYWWPAMMAHQLTIVTNFQSKIGGYAAILGLTPAEVAEATEICDSFAGAFSATQQCKATMHAMTKWRDAVFYGSPAGMPAPDAPVFPVVGRTTYTNGVVKRFIKLRDRIVASANYTVQIGEDLGIVGAEVTPISPGKLAPQINATTAAGFWVNLKGSMQGMDAMRVEYAPKGGNFTTVAFFTNTPGGFQITPANPNQPESGQIRAVFVKKNKDFGNYSAVHPVTLS
jgi:hypothetical protein